MPSRQKLILCTLKVRLRVAGTLSTVAKAYLVCIKS